MIAYLKPDILVLSGLDYDHDLHLLRAFRARIADHGHDMSHVFAFASNAGHRTGRDMTGDGRDDTPDDTQGYGAYSGERALALLSRAPIDTINARDFSDFLWQALPEARLPPIDPEILKIQRLSSTGHWDVPVVLSAKTRLHLLIYQAGPPVFGAGGSRNLLRNHDETAFWSAYLDKELPMRPSYGPIVIIGGSNLDQYDGDGMHEAMRALLGHPLVQDPMPASEGALQMATDPASATHRGPHGLDTVHWPNRPGNLRVSYILPSAELQVSAAGVFWPSPDTPEADLFMLGATPISRHYPVWVDIVTSNILSDDGPN